MIVPMVFVESGPQGERVWVHPMYTFKLSPRNARYVVISSDKCYQPVHCSSHTLVVLRNSSDLPHLLKPVVIAINEIGNASVLAWGQLRCGHIPKPFLTQEKLAVGKGLDRYRHRQSCYVIALSTCRSSPSWD